MSHNGDRGLKENVLGVFEEGHVIYLFYKPEDEKSDSLSVEISSDGENFTKFTNSLKIVDSNKKRVSPKDLDHISISRIYDNYYLLYKTKEGGNYKLFSAKSNALNSFRKVSELPKAFDSAVIVPHYKYNDSFLVFSGGANIKASFSRDLKSWQTIEEPVVKSYEDFFGKNPLKVGNIFVTSEGLMLVYFVVKSKNGINHFEIKALVLDKNDPIKIIRHVENVIWESPDELFEHKIEPVGIVKHGEDLVSFWKSKKGTFSINHPLYLFEGEKKHFAQIILHRIKHNPIIKPIIENLWESKATFNPAAIFEEGKVHIVYRAIGEDDVSVLGYAASFDGLHIDNRLGEPVYVPTQPFESSGPYRGVRKPGKFTSGGGCYGGCEDPRITRIDDKVYMTYVAYNGYSHPRVAITSIDFNDFVNNDFKWKKPVLISKPGIVDKNACILGEKIGGKYVIFHRVFPDILVDFVDDLNFDGTNFLEGKYAISPRPGYWDSRKIGIGPTPIKTDDGYLAIYQAVGDSDPGKYKIGAMLLDSNDPTRVITRSNEPILSPDVWYENEGFKAGVVYPCGAVNKDGKLIVYYGGADTVVCAAQANIDEFVHNLKKHRNQKLSPSYVS